jgi:putative transposase
MVPFSADDLGMTRSEVFSDELWAVIEPELPCDAGRRGRRWSSHRRVLEGISWRYRVGAPWRDLPADFGPWQTVWKRHHRWSLDGTYARIFAAVQHHYGPGDAVTAQIQALVSVDSTSIRAHQHGAGARNDVWTADALKRGSVELQDSVA